MQSKVNSAPSDKMRTIDNSGSFKSYTDSANSDKVVVKKCKMKR